jgi:hypothetical protein
MRGCLARNDRTSEGGRGSHPDGDAGSMGEESRRRFKLILKDATDLDVPPDPEIDASGAVAFSGVGSVADVKATKNARGQDIEYVTIEAIEVRLTD